MKISDLPGFNKPSSKILKDGAESLDTAELLSIIFGRGGFGESALELSNRLLKKYNLHGIEEAGLKELLNEIKDKRKKIKTYDYVKAMQLLSLIELSKRYNKLKNNGYKRIINSAKDVYSLLNDRFKNKKKEYLICLCLDTKNRIIREEVVSVGILNSSLIHPREVFKTAIKESANSIILVHNHPTGDCTPSEGDIYTTDKINEGGKIFKINLIDHVIIGKNKYYSFREEKKLS